jgi:hypothetical protein
MKVNVPPTFPLCDSCSLMEMCEHIVYLCCQINVQTLIEGFNILLYDEVEQIEMAKTALKKCTESQSVLFCCNSIVPDSNGDYNAMYVHETYRVGCCCSFQQRVSPLPWRSLVQGCFSTNRSLAMLIFAPTRPGEHPSAVTSLFLLKVYWVNFFTYSHFQDKLLSFSQDFLVVSMYLHNLISKPHVHCMAGMVVINVHWMWYATEYCRSIHWWLQN